MATTTVSADVSGLYTLPQSVIGRGTKASKVLVSKYSAGSADRTALGTWSATINDVFAVMPLEWDACIHSITVFNDDMDTNGSATLTVDVGVGHINRVTGTLTVDNITVYASASAALAVANAIPGASLFTNQSITLIGSGAGETPGTPARVLDDAGLTVIPEGSIPVLLIKAHAAAATAATAPKFAVHVHFTM